MTKAQLFITCLGDQFYTSTLQNMTLVLERLGVELTFPPEQTCCGQPLFNNGFKEKTRAVALNFLHAFGKSDAPIVAPSGSCVSMVKHHYAELFPEGTTEHELAVDIAATAAFIPVFILFASFAMRSKGMLMAPFTWPVANSPGERTSTTVAPSFNSWAKSTLGPMPNSFLSVSNMGSGV